MEKLHLASNVLLSPFHNPIDPTPHTGILESGGRKRKFVYQVVLESKWLSFEGFLPSFLYTLTHTHILKGLLSFSSKWKLNDIIYTSIYVKFGIKCIYFTHSLLQTHQRGGISYLYNPIYYLLQSANATIHKITPW